MSGEHPRAALARLVSERGDSLAALSRLLGRNPAYLQQYVTRGSPRLLAERDRRLLARYFGVEESVLGGPVTPELAGVARLDVAASAGAGALAESEDALRLARFDRALLRALGVRPEAASLIRVTGESMLPTLAHGDEILVDCDDRAPSGQAALFVVRHEGALLVKRVERRGGRVLICSDNPAFPPIDAEPGDVEVIGRVVWLGRALRGR